MNCIRIKPDGVRRIELEAAQYCDEHGITDLKACQQVAQSLAYRAYMRDTESLREIKVRSLAAALTHPIWIQHQDGRIEVQEVKRPPELDALFLALDAEIQRVAESYGLELTILNPRAPAI